MPTYQYVCTQCATPLEAVQSFSDSALTECPTCAGQLRKVFSAVGVVFKGSGFYKTDSRVKSGASAAGGDSKGGEGKGGDGKGSDGRAESKGDTKADAGSGKTKADSSPSGSTPSGGKDGGGASAPAKSGGKPAVKTSSASTS